MLGRRALSLISIEIINNTRAGIEGKIWERAIGGQISEKVLFFFKKGL